MFKMWDDLQRRFFLGGAVSTTAVYARMIAMLVFWWVWMEGTQARNNPALFRDFFDVDEKLLSMTRKERIDRMLDKHREFEKED